MNYLTLKIWAATAWLISIGKSFCDLCVGSGGHPHTPDEQKKKHAVEGPPPSPKPTRPPENRITFAINKDGRFFTEFEIVNRSEFDAQAIGLFLNNLHEGAFMKEIVQNMLLTKDATLHRSLEIWGQQIENSKPVVPADQFFPKKEVR